MGQIEAPALPCTLQKVSLNRRDRLGGTTLPGNDTSDTVADSLTNLPKNIQSQDEPDVGSSEECLPNLPGPQAWLPQKSGVQRLIWSRDQYRGSLLTCHCKTCPVQRGAFSSPQICSLPLKKLEGFNKGS